MENFSIVDELLSLQIVNLARFARNVEWDCFLWFSTTVLPVKIYRNGLLYKNVLRFSSSCTTAELHTTMHSLMSLLYNFGSSFGETFFKHLKLLSSWSSCCFKEKLDTVWYQFWVVLQDVSFFISLVAPSEELFNDSAKGDSSSKLSSLITQAIWRGRSEATK